MTMTTHRTKSIAAHAIVVAATCAIQQTPAAPAESPAAVVAGQADVNGTSIHYLRSGSGKKTIVLLHGWPESSYEWRRVIPALSAEYTVIAPDLRGVGGSPATATGYDKATLAEDVHQLVMALQLKHVLVVGHDIGGMVAYAYARSHPEDLAGVAILDIPIAGIDPWDTAKSAPWAWHFGFHAVPGLAEALVADRQEAYFRHFFDDFSATPSAIPEQDRKVYADAYRDAASLKAGFELYRAFPRDEAFNRSHSGPLSVPVLIGGGDHSGGPMLRALAQGLTSAGIASIKEVVFGNCGHWIPEEQPQALIDAIEAFASAN
jgi:pimeloyl-ACP methyl ester carboxylesterase